MQLVLPLGAPCLGDHVGAFAVAVDLTGSEKSLVSARRRRSQREEDADRWGHLVSDSVFENGFSIFAELNE